MTTQTWFRGLAAIVMAALVWLLLSAAALFQETKRTVGALPEVLDRAIEREGNATRALAARVALDAQQAVVGEVRESRGAVLAQVDRLGGQVIREVAATRTAAELVSYKALDISNSRAGELLAEMAAARRELVAVAAPPTVALTKALDGIDRNRQQLFDRIDPWTDCEGNGACWQAQGTALLGAARVTAGRTSQTMEAVRLATPKIADNVEKTTANVARLTTPESLGMKVIKTIGPLVGGALFGAIK
jgi:hypothetical protein